MLGWYILGQVLVVLFTWRLTEEIDSTYIDKIPIAIGMILLTLVVLFGYCTFMGGYEVLLLLTE
jgi:hypothetical protein